MKNYKLDILYAQFLTRCIVCCGLLPLGYLLHKLWSVYIRYDIKNYIFELLVHLLGFISDAVILISAFLTILCMILLIVKTIKQIRKENSVELLKKPKFIIVCILILIVISFSGYLFFEKPVVDVFACWYYG